ncbi:DUF2867 domain-containing protein [Niallia sp. 03190]|uniref:DUF2867 domain-containing protein n=1 Tax=Niallia sp. 03190 TaxID=3458061 RepID=UPI004044B938
MVKYSIKEVSVPKNSLASQAFSNIHYSDAYKALLPNKADYEVDSLTRLFFTSVPSWVSHLMKVRDKIVRLIGLKTSNRFEVQNMTFEQGSNTGIFHVKNRSSNEILLGEDDRHLNFRMSILLNEGNGSTYVTVSTIVYMNNWLGRLYFFMISKIHKFLVPVLLKNMIRNINSR